jgi:hypothetical protein
VAAFYSFATDFIPPSKISTTFEAGIAISDDSQVWPSHPVEPDPTLIVFAPLIRKNWRGAFLSWMIADSREGAWPTESARRRNSKSPDDYIASPPST